MSYVDYLRNLSRRDSNPELFDIADYLENLEKTNRRMFVDLKASEMFKFTEEQWFDKYGYFRQPQKKCLTFRQESATFRLVATTTSLT